MPPLQKQRNFKQSAFMTDICKAVNINKSLKNGTETIKHSPEEQKENVEPSESILEPSVVKSVPNSLAQFSCNLTELELSNQNFTDLPDLFKSIGNLKKLYIHDTLLTELPSSIEELKNLHELNLSHNELYKLPESISNLKHLEKLNLSHNQLMKLPLSYAKLQLLRELDLSFNKFLRLPKCIANGMGTLRVLNISENLNVRINVIPSSKYLEKFLARNNKNSGTFPDWLLCSKFFNMKEFNLDNTQFNIYSFNGKEGNLYYTKLCMNSSNLSSRYLDMMIEHMTSLQIINVGNQEIKKDELRNFFNYIPIKTFRNPKLITELNFRGTGIANVPTTINQLCNLKTIDLGLNSISWFPDEFCELEKLQHLKIDGNNLILLPENIGNLVSVEEIHAEDNSVETLPDSLKNLKNLKLLDLYNNKLAEKPELLCKLENLKGLDVELNYFTTSDEKVGKTDYSALLEYLRKEKSNYRSMGDKPGSSTHSDYDSCKEWYYDDYASSQENDQNYVCNASEENWDTSIDTDDDFEPNSSEINYNERSKEYLRANFTPLGFCPADIHSLPIQQEVASMRAYGSMPSYKIVEGQFDDA